MLITAVQWCMHCARVVEILVDGSVFDHSTSTPSLSSGCLMACTITNAGVCGRY